MPTTPNRPPLYKAPQPQPAAAPDDEEQDGDLGVHAADQPDEALPPVMPRPSALPTRAYSRPVAAPATGPKLGETGGIVADQPSRTPPTRWSDDPVERRQQALERAQGAFEAKQRAANPFLFSGAVKQLSKVGGRRAEIDAIRQAESEYNDQLASDRASAMDQRRAEAEQRKVGNEAAIQGMLATGQKYRRDEFGNIQPIMDAQGRPLYKPTPWRKGVHPKTNRPVLEMKDQYGQRQYKAPPLKEPVDPMDDHLYADFGDEESVPYMTKAEAAASSDISLKNKGIRALLRQTEAKAAQRLSSRKQEVDIADRDYDLAASTIAANRERANAIMRAGGDQAEAAKLEDEAIALEEKTRPRGPLALRKAVSRIDLELEQAELKREARLLQRDAIAARVMQAGGDPASDPSFLANEAELVRDEATLASHRKARENVGKLMEPVPAAVPVAKPEEIGTLHGIANVARRAGNQAVGGIKMLGAVASGYRNKVNAENADKLDAEATNVDALHPDWSPEKKADFVARSSEMANRLRGFAEGGKQQQSERVVGAAQSLKDASAISGAPGYEDYSKARGSEAVKRFFANPVEVASNIAVEGAIGSIPILAAGTLGGATAGLPGAATGTGLGSFATEYASTMLDTLGKAGVDISDPNALMKAMGDDRLMSVARKRAVVRGIPVAVFDALSGGLAGRTVAPVVKSGLKQILKAGAKEVGEQAALGMAGEAAGQVALQANDTGQVNLADLDFKDIFAEGIGEVVPGAGQIAFGAATRGRGEGSAPSAGEAPPAGPAPTEPVPAAPTEIPPEDAELERVLSEPASAAAETGNAPDVAAASEVAPVTPEAVATAPTDQAAAAEPEPSISSPPLQEPVGGAGSAPDTGAGVETAQAPALGRPPVETDASTIAADRTEYDRLQAELRSRRDYGSPEYNAVWQASEDIKNRHGGMPPGGVAGGDFAASKREGRFELVGSRLRGDNRPDSDFDVVTTLTPEELKAYESNGPDEFPVLPQDIKDRVLSKKGDVFIQNGNRLYKVEEHPITDGEFVVERVSEKEQNILAGGKKGENRRFVSREQTLRDVQNPETQGAPTNALPEQIPDTSVLRPEQPQVGLPEVAEGNAQPEGTPRQEAPRPEAVREEVAPRPATAELRKNDAGANLPPVSSLSQAQKRAELAAAGVTTYNGKAIADLNPAELSNAVGKNRRGELEAVPERASDRVIKKLRSAKIDTRGKLFDATAGIPIAAYNAALDIAIVAIKAGRTVADAVKLAVARYRALHKGATDDDVARLTKAVQDAGAPPEPPAGQTFKGPVNEAAKRNISKSMLGAYEYVPTTNAAQQEFAQKFAADFPDTDTAIREMRGINEPAMRSNVAAELLARVMDQWQSASVADKTALMAKAQSLINDVKADKTEAAQALQSQAVVNERLRPFAPLLAYMDLIRQRYGEIEEKVGANASDKVKSGLNEAGNEAATEINEALKDKPGFKNAAAADEWLGKFGKTVALLRKAAKSRDINLADLFKSLPQEQEARKAELIDRVRKDPKFAGLTPEQATRLGNNLDEAWTYLRNAIFRQEFSRLVQLPNIKPGDAKKVKSVVGELIKYANLGTLDNQAFLNAVAEKYGLERMDGPTAQRLTELAFKMQNAKTDAERARASMEMYGTVAKARGITPGDALISAYYSNLLNSIITTTYAMAGGNLIQTVWNLGTLAATHPKSAGAVARGYRTGIPEGLRQALSIIATGHGGEDAAAKLVEAKGEPLEQISEGGVWPEFEAKNPKTAKAIQMTASAAKMVPRVARAIDAMFYYPAKQATLRFITEQALQADYPNATERANKAAEILGVSPKDFIAAEAKAKSEGFSGLDMSLRIADMLEPKSAIGKIAAASETQRYLTEKQREVQESVFGKKAMEQATKIAEKTTLSQDPEGWAGVAYRGASNASESFRPGGIPVGKFIWPFLRLPTNFYNANIAATPLGLVPGVTGQTLTGITKKQGEWRKTFRELSEPERKQIYLQALIGSTAMAYFVAKAAKADPDDDEAFDITANGPSDPALRRQMESHGWKKNSIRIPGTNTRVDYMNTPMAIPLKMAGHMADAYRFRKDGDELVFQSKLADAAARAPAAIFGMPALSGMQTLAELLDEENTSAEKVTKFLASTGKNLVRPRLIEEIDRIMDPTVKDDGIIRYDELGEPVERSPLSRVAKTESEDPVRQLLLKNKLRISVADRDSAIEGVKMTPEQLSEYVRISGQRIKQRLAVARPAIERLVASDRAYNKRMASTPKFKPRSLAQDYIDRVTREERENAKRAIRRSALTAVSTK